jgi:hypothetical protein
MAIKIGGNTAIDDSRNFTAGVISNVGSATKAQLQTSPYAGTYTGEVIYCSDLRGGVIVYWDGSEWSGTNALVATGGTKTTIGSKVYHTFTGSSPFVVTGSGDVEYVLVGGGGGTGGPQYHNGGGGAGGYRTGTVNLTEATYTVTVGAGGAATPNGQAGGSGGFSRLGPVYVGGGGGGSAYSSSVAGDGSVSPQGGDGGSGGGGSSSGSSAKQGGTGGPYGNDGGTGSGNGPRYGGGGGGGSGGTGVNGESTGNGHGGIGTKVPSTFQQPGLPTAGRGAPGRIGDNIEPQFWFAGGGGGSSYNGPSGGQGGGPGGPYSGGGNGSNEQAQVGATNTGGGAGGSERVGTASGGRTGGSGIVLLAYPT